MKIKGKYIKRGTIITVVSIIVLTLATMNVSYSSFFSVQTQTNVPVITAGNLSVKASVTGMDSATEGIMPSSGYSGISGNGSSITGEENKDYIKSTLTVTNESNIKATIGVSLQNSNTANNQNASPGSVVIAIQKNNSWMTFGTNNIYWVQLDKLVTSGDGIYPIIKDNIEASSGNGTVATYDIYMWIKTEANEEDSEKNLNYSISVKAIPAEGQDGSNTVPDVSTNS